MTFAYLSCSSSRSWKHFQEAGNSRFQDGGGRGASGKEGTKGGEVPYYREGSNLPYSSVRARRGGPKPLRRGVGASQKGYCGRRFPGGC